MSIQPAHAQSRLRKIIFGISNLANYIVGAGILGLPFVFSKTGWAVGCCLILLAAFATSLSFDFLLQASVASGCYSYDSLALRTGGTLLQKFVKVVIIIDSFGPLSGYMIVIGDALRTFILGFGSANTPALSKPALTAYAVLIFIVPLCFLKTLDKLGFTSVLSLVPLVYLLFFQVVHLASDGLAPSSSYAPGVGGNNGIFVCLPIVVFAYSSQQALFPIYSDLRGVPDLSDSKGSVEPSPSDSGVLNSSHFDAAFQASDVSVDNHVSSSDVEESHPVRIDDAAASASCDSGLVSRKLQDSHENLQDMKLIVRITMVVTSVSYILCAALGYLSFPTTAAGNILKTYPASAANDILVLSMAASIILSYPVIVFPCRQSVDRLLFPNKELTYIRYVAQNIAIVAVAYGIATAVPVFSTLLGVFGAVTSTIIAYILPTFFYMRTSNTSFLKDRFSWVALTLLILGSSAGMASFAFIIEDTAKNGLGSN